MNEDLVANLAFQNPLLLLNGHAIPRNSPSSVSVRIDWYNILMKTIKSLSAVASVAKGKLFLLCILLLAAGVSSCLAQSLENAPATDPVPPDANLMQKQIIRRVVNELIPPCETDIQKAIGTPIKFDVQWAKLLPLRTQIDNQNRTAGDEAVGLVGRTIKSTTEALEKIALDQDGKSEIARKVKTIVISAKAWDLTPCPLRPGQKPDPDKRSPMEKYVSLSNGTLFVFVHLSMNQIQKSGQIPTVGVMDYPDAEVVKTALMKLL